LGCVNPARRALHLKSALHVGLSNPKKIARADVQRIFQMQCTSSFLKINKMVYFPRCKI
jgi:hypothetical protein